MTRPIALCWAAGVKWGHSVPGMQALFVRGALGRNYTGRSNDPQPGRQPAPRAPSAPSSSAWGDESDTGWHSKRRGGGETLPLNTSPTDRCCWPFLNLIIVVLNVGGDKWDFCWHSLPYLFLPFFFIRTLSRCLRLCYRLTHLYTDTDSEIYLSIYPSGGYSKCRLLKMAILTAWSLPLSLLSMFL